MCDGQMEETESPKETGEKSQRSKENHDGMITEESDATWSRRRRVTTEYHS